MFAKTFWKGFYQIRFKVLSFLNQKNILMVALITIVAFSYLFLKLNFNSASALTPPTRNLAEPFIPFSRALLTSESSFQSTFKSCLNENCFNQPVLHIDGSKVLRVGFLSLPLSGGQILFDLIEQLRPKYSQKHKNIEFFLESHVPAYGYGKNHGYSSLIRFSRRALDHAYALISQSNATINSVNFESHLKQIVTWHCRLNHVAAHTRLLTG
jgi:hypothetical protein